MCLLSAISFLQMVELELCSVLQSMWCYVGFEVSSCIYNAEGSCVVTRQTYRRLPAAELQALW